MRFQINFDCTPEEAREFFGVPDLMPMQTAMMDQINAKLMDQMKTMDTDTLMQTWIPALFQGWSEMQQNIWKSMGGMANVNINPEPKSKSK